MASAAREDARRARIDALTDRLITNVTGIKASDDDDRVKNFKLCRGYCDYHLHVHTYADRDGRDVMNVDVREVLEKLTIASQGDKVRVLEEKIEALTRAREEMSSSMEPSSTTWRGDVHGAELGEKIVLMLLRLSRRPLSTNLRELGIVSEGEGAAAVRRGAADYDSEDEDALSTSSSFETREREAVSDSTLSEWSDDDDENAMDHENDGIIAQTAVDITEVDDLGFSWRDDLRGDAEAIQVSASSAKALCIGDEFVPDVVSQARALQAALRMTNERRGGDAFLATASAKHLPSESSLVSGALHALSLGSSNLEHVSLPHVSHGTIEGALTSIRCVAEDLERLRMMKVKAKKCGPTIQAFAEALDKQAHVLRRKLIPLETRLSEDDIENKGKPTLLELRTTVRLFESKVDSLERAARMAFPVDNTPAAEAASHCLSTLYDLISDYQAAADIDGFTLMLRVFIDTIQPYLASLHRWLALGLLDDPAGELFIAPGPSVHDKVGSKEHWVHGYVLRHDVETPRFLGGLTSNILDVGRSLKLLHCTEAGHSQSVSKFDTHIGVLFIDSMLDMMRAESQAISVVGENGVHAKDAVRQFSAPTKTPILDIFGHASNLINIRGVSTNSIVREVISRPTRVVSSSQGSSKSKLQSSVDALDTWLDVALTTQIPVCPMNLLIQKSLISHIDNRAKEVQLKLVQRLRDVWLIKKELYVLRAVFLGGAGDAANNFFTSIFSILDDPDKIDSKWNETTLNELLDNAFAMDISGHLPEDRSVNIEIIPEAERNIFSRVVIGTGSLEKIASLRYAFDVQWPHSIVIPPSAVAQYNDITVFLTQLRRANSAIQNVSTARWTEQIRRAPGNGLGGPVARRFEPRLKCFISSLYRYVFLRILDTEWETMLESVDRALTLDDIRSAHEEFLNVASRQCLVSPDPTWTLLAEQIRTILAVSCEYFACQLSDGSISEDDASRLSATFEDSHEYILRVLNNKLDVGTAAPEVEELLSALSII